MGRNVIEEERRFSITSPLFKRKADARQLPRLKQNNEFASTFASPFFADTILEFPKSTKNRIAKAVKPKIQFTYMKPKMCTAETQIGGMMCTAETQVTENDFPKYQIGTLT